MIFNYVNFTLYIVFLGSGVFIGVYYVKTFSNDMTRKFENALNEQMEIYKKFSRESLEFQIKSIESVNLTV